MMNTCEQCAKFTPDEGGFGECKAALPAWVNVGARVMVRANDSQAMRCDVWELRS